MDHIALTAGGVYVIDTKHYRSAKVKVRRSGGLFSPVREQLMVNWRDRSKLLDSVARQAVAVRTALNPFVSMAWLVSGALLLPLEMLGHDQPGDSHARGGPDLGQS